MKLEVLQKEKIVAMKNKDEVRKQVLSDMIDMVQKASITAKGRVEITEELVDATLVKYQKMTQEMIDTCPASRTDKLEQYTAAMAVVKEYAPQLITDEGEIKEIIEELVNNTDLTLTKKDMGRFMKIFAHQNIDKGVASKILREMMA